MISLHFISSGVSGTLTKANCSPQSGYVPSPTMPFREREADMPLATDRIADPEVQIESTTAQIDPPMLRPRRFPDHPIHEAKYAEKVSMALLAIADGRRIHVF